MRVTRTPSVPKGQTLRKAWRSLGSPTPDKAAWSPPLMYQYGETVITPRERMSRARLRLTSTVLKKPPLDGPGRRPYIANIPIQLWQSFFLTSGSQDRLQPGASSVLARLCQARPFRDNRTNFLALMIY